MHFLDTITIVLAGLMVGNELAVTAFFNPAARKLEITQQAQALSVLAVTLGRVMPVWYGLCLALLVLESFLHRRQPALVPLLTATLICRIPSIGSALSCCWWHLLPSSMR